jgi:hypothetical protein
MNKRQICCALIYTLAIHILFLWSFAAIAGDIPQPVSYTHFHWITTASSDPRAEMVPEFCDKNKAGQLETQAPTAVNETCSGWFLEIEAVMEFAFQHGIEVVPVYSGMDNATHVNLVTNYAEVPGITYTRSDEVSN